MIKNRIIISLIAMMSVLFMFCYAYADLINPISRDEEIPSTEPDIWSEVSSWAIEELTKASENNLIPISFNGKDFTKNITREEFAEISVLLYEKLNGSEITYDNALPFEDTTNVNIAKAYVVGITSGTSETTFSPEKEITREEMATMISRALQKSGIDTKAYDPTARVEFTDHSLMHDWSEDAIYFMADKEIIKGIGEGLFGVNDKATREQALIISERCKEKFENVERKDVVTPVLEESTEQDSTVVSNVVSTEEVVSNNSMAIQAFNGKFERNIGEGRRQTVAYQLCDLITTNNASGNGQVITIEFIDLDGQSREVSDVASIHEITATIIKANNVKYDISCSYDDAGYINKVTYKSVK